MKPPFYYTLIIALTIFIATPSCKKEEPDAEAQAALDNSFCENEFSRIFTMVTNYGINEKGIRLPGNCPSTYIDPADTANGFPIRLELDYGTGCTDIDGKIRKGKIYADFSEKWSNIANKPTINISFINYKVNDITLNCDSMLITRDAANVYKTKVVNSKVSNNNWQIEWNSNQTMTQTAGFGDTIATNDVFEFIGTTSGVDKKERQFKTEITLPLTKAATCNWISKGRLDLTPDKHSVRTVDFGTGTCDNDATLTINGNIYSFKLE